MGYYVGLDVSLKTTAICVVGEDGKVAWQGSSDTHPDGKSGDAARHPIPKHRPTPPRRQSPSSAHPTSDAAAPGRPKSPEP